MRAFIAISLPDPIRSSLTALQQDLMPAGADVKWVEPPNLHVTLAFLGEITEEQRQALERALARVAVGEQPFELSLGSPGAFPSLSAPRVVWVGLDRGREAAARLALGITQECRSLSLRCEERPFAAHITVGRVRSPRKRQGLVQRLQNVEWLPPAPWRVEAITLYQSLLSSDGPRYSVLATIPLAPSSQ